MSDHLLLTDIANSVATVTINRPDKGNAMSPLVLELLARCFEELSKRTDVRVIVLTGGEAERMGYVSRVYPKGELPDAVGKIATDMATFDRLCLAETTRLSNQVLGQDLDNAMRTQE